MISQMISTKLTTQFEEEDDPETEDEEGWGEDEEELGIEGEDW